MPTVEEAEQERQSYGNASGWSDRQVSIQAGPNAPALNQAKVPPTSDASAASSAEPVPQEQVSEQAPPPTSQPEPEQTWNAPPKERWEERQQELERERAARAEAERQIRLLTETLQRVTPSTQSPPAHTPDFWEGRTNHADPATAQYWQQQRQMFDLAVQKGKQEAIAELQPVIQAGMTQLAQLNTRTFRQENPEIAPGSQDEALVIAYMEGRAEPGVRHSIESAKRNAMYDRIKAENQALKSKHALIPAKRVAGQTESSAGIPQSAGLPPRPGDWRQVVSDVVDRGGKTIDAAKAIFGG